MSFQKLGKISKSFQSSGELLQKKPFLQPKAIQWQVLNKFKQYIFGLYFVKFSEQNQKWKKVYYVEVYVKDNVSDSVVLNSL